MTKRINKVLLIQPPYTVAEDVAMTVEPPMGLAYIAAVLGKNNFDVSILDCIGEGYRNVHRSKTNVYYGLDFDTIAQRIERAKPDVIGISCMFTIQYQNVRRILELAKEKMPDAITVVGGAHPTARFADVMNQPELDYVILGEGEDSFLHLLNCLRDGRGVEDVDGLVFRKEGNVVRREKTAFIENLDLLPFPAMHLLPMDEYFKAGKVHGISRPGKRVAQVITSRGCPAHCVFCTIGSIWGRKFRAHSPKRVLDEIEYLKRTYKIDSIQFEDDNITFDQVRAKEIFKGMIDRCLNLKWNAPNGVAIWAMNEELLDLMKASGCTQIKFAVESGDQYVLDNIIKKPVRLDNARRLIRHCHDIGLDAGSFFVVGLPGETKEQMQRTFDFAIENDLLYADYSIATPHYGSELFDIVKRGGYLADDFCESDLFARRATITTPDFSADWLVKKVNKEILRFNFSLLRNHPIKFFKSVVFNYFASDPLFILGFFIKKLKGLIREA